MTELHFLQNTAEKLTWVNLSKLGYKITFDKDGYSIVSNIGTIYGFAVNNIVKSIYVYRSTGDWKTMLREIDKVVHIEFHDDSFIDELMHSDWTEQETYDNLKLNVIKNRQILNLQ